MFVDVHAHLQDKQFDRDRDKVIERAEQSGVNTIIVAGSDLEENKSILTLVNKHKIVKAALGFHPVFVNKESIKELDKVLNFIKKNKSKIIAISEIGLDYHYSIKYKKEQIEVFRDLLQLAKDIKKPVIVHSRKAEEDVIDILEESGLKKVVLHSFEGKKSLFKKILEKNWFFSIPTNVVRSTHLQDLVKITNIDKLFAETDSPVLSPFRGKRNEPSFIVESYKMIAKLKKLYLTEVENLLFMNYQRLFI